MPVQGPRFNHTVTTLAYVNCDRTFEMDLVASPGLRSVGTLRRSVLSAARNNYQQSLAILSIVS